MAAKIRTANGKLEIAIGEYLADKLFIIAVQTNRH
jgi:hypothetical protein